MRRKAPMQPGPVHSACAPQLCRQSERARGRGPSGVCAAHTHTHTQASERMHTASVLWLQPHQHKQTASAACRCCQNVCPRKQVCGAALAPCAPSRSGT
ncbi:hypothetical protein BC831DRAFT_461115 [Entophlyctis helioformis]|nr:hypothetical protein BC831DRAFT_461115 [Entophlyctis helioformis]